MQNATTMPYTTIKMRWRSSCSNVGIGSLACPIYIANMNHGSTGLCSVYGAGQFFKGGRILA